MKALLFSLLTPTFVFAQDFPSTPTFLIYRALVELERGNRAKAIEILEDVARSKCKKHCEFVRMASDIVREVRFREVERCPVTFAVSREFFRFFFDVMREASELLSRFCIYPDNFVPRSRTTVALTLEKLPHKTVYLLPKHVVRTDAIFYPPDIFQISAVFLFWAKERFCKSLPCRFFFAYPSHLKRRVKRFVSFAKGVSLYAFGLTYSGTNLLPVLEKVSKLYSEGLTQNLPRLPALAFIIADTKTASVLLPQFDFFEIPVTPVGFGWHELANLLEEKRNYFFMDVLSPPVSGKQKLLAYLKDVVWWVFLGGDRIYDGVREVVFKDRTFWHTFFVFRPDGRVERILKPSDYLNFIYGKGIEDSAD